MRCLTCNTDNPDSNRFCEHCGGRFALVCQSCGRENKPTARFCGDCGTGLTTTLPRGESARSSAPADSNAGRSGTELWGELKIATVLFADIASSTEQIADLGPEEAMERLQPAVLQMCDAVERFGGTVVRTLGDGIMALFGVPKALEGHVRLACEAALSIQAIFANDAWGLNVRIGLHTGQVASNPTVGESARSDGVHGLTIHLASRVMASAEPGSIRLTHASQTQAAEHYDADRLGQFALRGISEQTTLYTLRGRRMDTGKPQARVHTPFRGRDREMGLLQLALHRAGNKCAPVVGVTGEPGTGKSRLCYEFAQWSSGRGVVVHEVRAQLYGHATPLQPVLELFRNCFFHIGHGDDAASAREKIARRLMLPGEPGVSPMEASDVLLLADFLGVNDPSAPPLTLNPRSRQARLLAAMRYLVRQPGNGLAMLILEDLHWLDEASMEFVSALVDAVAGTRVLLVLNYRPTFSATWEKSERFSKIELTELSGDDMNHLVRELISHRRELLDICELIARRSGGNPFFAEELVRSLAESGVLSGEPGAPGHGITAIERALPSNVQSVIGARIDRLREPVKALLQVCSTIGKEIPLSVLEQVADVAAVDVAQGLEELCAAELMQPQPDEDGPHFAFRHPLIQEVAYSMQLKARRTILHAAVAEAMKDHYRLRGDEFAALIAHHYEAAGQMVHAATHASRAAQWFGRTSSAQAIKHWHKVRQLLPLKTGTGDGDKLRAMASSQIALLGWREGLSLQEAQLYIEEAMTITELMDSRLKQLLFMIEGRLVQANGGSADGYVQKVQQALSLATLDADPGRVAMLNAALSQAYSWAGLLDAALEANDRALSDVHQIDSFDSDFIGFDVKQWMLGVRARILIRLDRSVDAQKCLQNMLKSPGTTGDPVIEQVVHFCYIDLALWEGDALMAQQHAAQMNEVVEKHPGLYMKAFALCGSGLAHLASMAYPQARATFREALELIRSGQVAMEFETEVLTGLAESCYRLGDEQQALDYALEAAEMSRKRSHRLSECRALMICAAIFEGASFKDEAAAIRCREQASELIQVTGAVRYLQAMALAQLKVIPPIDVSSVLQAGSYVH